MNVIEITDFRSPELDVYARLTERELRHPQKGMGLFIAESPNVIERALDAHYTPVSLLMEKKHIEGQAAHVIARCGDVPVFTAPLPVLTQLTGFALTRGVLCAMQRRPLPAPEKLCTSACRIAVLENVMNPTNLGAVFRSAAALGMDAVLLTSRCTDPLYRRAARVSMGTVFQIPWTYLPEAPDAAGAVQMLRGLGFRSAAMALCDDSVSIDDPAVCGAEKLAIVLGTEGEGLSPETITACDHTVRIPMSHGVDSLNVAAASAVAFWEMRVR